MTVRERHLVGGGIVLVAALVSVLAYPRVPADVVTHWGSGGPDGTMDRVVALAGMPLLAAGVLAALELVPRLDPLGAHIRDLGRYYDALVVVIVGVVGYVHLLVVLWNLGYTVDVVQAIAPAVATVYYVTGVVLARVDRNWFVGIRTPWTLSSDRVWARTHARGAALFKGCAAVALAAVVVPGYATWLLVGPVVASALLLAGYSYLAYTRLPESGSPDDNA